jgi:hypothetical protein
LHFESRTAAKKVAKKFIDAVFPRYSVGFTVKTKKIISFAFGIAIVPIKVGLFSGTLNLCRVMPIAS